MQNTVILLRQAYKLNTKEVGGKALPLSFLANKHLNIPKGFVVASSVFKNIEKQIGLDKKISQTLAQLRRTKMKNLDRSSYNLRKTIENIPLPQNLESAIYKMFKKLKAKYVSVRSSAACEDHKNHSWAGEFETHTWVDDKSLIKKIKKCWSSLYTPRALMYAHRQKLDFATDMAVLVQVMIDSEVSGVCFTKELDDPDSGLMVIEAIYGLGELLVGGESVPDKYWVDKREKIILDIDVSSQKIAMTSLQSKGQKKRIPEKQQMEQKLSGKEIISLAEIALKIEKIMNNKPQDIEWALSRGRFYVLQSRPITAYNF